MHGWDGTGYQRFFSPTRESFPAWTWATALTCLASDVAILLLVMLGVMVLWILGLTVSWLRAGARGRGREPSRPTVLAVSVLGLLLVAIPALAVVSNLMVRWLGAAGGVLCTVTLFAALCSRRVGALRMHFASLRFSDRIPSNSTRPT